MEEAYAKMCESGISFVSLEDASYPKRLRHIANPPYGLYVKGCLPQGETVAIVGARMCSEYGRTVARELGRMLAARGVGVVGGMARGIDAAGHQGALDVGGISCAVLGCGVDVCYPRAAGRCMRRFWNGARLSRVSARHAADSGIFSAAQPHHIRACPGGCCGGGKAAERIADHGGFCAGAGEGCLCHSGQDYRCLVGGMQQQSGRERGQFPISNRLYRSLRRIPERAGRHAPLKNYYLKRRAAVYSCVDLRPKSMEELLEETDLSVPELAQILGILLKKGLLWKHLRIVISDGFEKSAYKEMYEWLSTLLLSSHPPR